MRATIVEQFLDFLYRVFLLFMHWVLRHPGFLVAFLVFVGGFHVVFFYLLFVRPRLKIRSKERTRQRSFEKIHAPRQEEVANVDVVRFIVLLPDLAKKITSADTLDKIGEVLVREIQLLFPQAKEVGLFLPEKPNHSGGSLDGGDSNYVLRFSTGIEKRDEMSFVIPYRKGLIGFTASQAMILWRDELESRFGRQIAAQDEESKFYAPSVAVPILLRNQLLGILTLHPLVRNTERQSDQQILSIVGDLMAISLSHAQKIVKLHQINVELNEKSQQLARFNQNLTLEVHRQTAELQETEHRLFQAEQLALFGEFVATLTHDIKNPLAFISGESQWALELLDDSGLDRDGLRKSLGIISKNSLRLQQDLQALLGRLQVPKTTRERTSLTKVISETVALIQRHAEQKGITLREIYPPEETLLACFPGLLRHAFMNLLSNALEALTKGGLLEIRLTSTKEGYDVKVQDTGCGIDPADLSHIFELFYTKRRGGAGLGLSSVKRIIETKHAGRVEVESKPGKGTTFLIHLPRKEGV